jgi:3-isopropylmalate/(R)-2-methylmalate dehydratase small subunit
MAAAASAAPLTVDLQAQIIGLPAGPTITFQIDPHRRQALLLGLDQIGAILADDAGDIAAFESRQRAQAPWLHLDRRKLSYFDNLGSKDGT